MKIVEKGKYEQEEFCALPIGECFVSSHIEGVFVKLDDESAFDFADNEIVYFEGDTEVTVRDAELHLL